MTATAESASVTKPSDREIRIERTFDAAVAGATSSTPITEYSGSTVGTVKSRHRNESFAHSSLMGCRAT